MHVFVATYVMIKDIFGNKKFLGDKKEISQAFSSLSNARGKQVSKNIELNENKRGKNSRANIGKKKWDCIV